ncbi:MAG: Hsp20/alpha crystallin family protein [Blastococcus sp.]
MRFDPFGDPFRGLDRLTSQLLSGARTPMAMPMDVWQSEDGYHVTLDLPGVDPESVEITSERNVLTIRAERRPGYEENDRVLVAERPHGQYVRQLQVGDALDSGNVAATYHNGVLHLTIPISAAAQPRRIEVRQGGDEQPVAVPAEAAGAGRSAAGATAGPRG